NDVGGDKVLQKKWTTFLKAQLSCSQAGLFPHTVLQHVFALPQPGGGSLFYGVFASQWQTGSSGSSAVCAFSLDAIEKAFAGKYKELNKDCSRWMTYSGPAMDPRPGSCSVGPSSDKALTFMKDHFLMDEKVAPVHNQPLLVKEDVKYTRIAVHQAQAACGTACTVLFLGTGRAGSLHLERR
ncbi:semaphorin-4A-like, partial [Pseudonaja textilis]|uniref:semaphorin-4A-like n=1 Tax=Pseudonaja textilis TaxID=8673 RepID=UPI000EAA4EA0